ncbi:MAG: DNA-protecting protein DprA [Chloroflexi bacterium]|nr:DNA-protecting protein DprA [Chloroflexota bacterium]
MACWVAFNQVQGVGPVRFRLLLERFGDLYTAWHANPLALKAAGLDGRPLENLLQVRLHLDLAKELDRLAALSIRVETWETAGYPRLLREIATSPPVLYFRGEYAPSDEFAVGIVGTRTPTSYGRDVAVNLAEGLASNGITVVSGLARGIDTWAHQGALKAKGRTLAVLGSGVDIIYPPENWRLAESIMAGHGALISEYALGTKPEAMNFPPRNRIISGLSLGVVVVQAGEKSGALITATFAAEQGRDVFAVPGNINVRNSAGTNRLIRDGAYPVAEVRDILEQLNLNMINEQQIVREIIPANPTEQQLLNHLGDEPVHIDELGRSCNLPIAEISATLTLMELKGMVRQAGNMQYIRA